MTSILVTAVKNFRVLHARSSLAIRPPRACHLVHSRAVRAPSSFARTINGRCVMRSTREVNRRCPLSYTAYPRNRPIEIQRAAKPPPDGFPDNLTRTMSRMERRSPEIETQSARARALLTDRRCAKYHSGSGRFCRGGDGCLCAGSSVSSPSSRLLSFSPAFCPPPRDQHSSLRRSRRDSAGRSGWTTLSRARIRPFFPRILDKSIGHPAAFCPLFAATLSTYRERRRRRSNEEADGGGGVVAMTHGCARERESGFDFISRMNMQRYAPRVVLFSHRVVAAVALRVT